VGLYEAEGYGLPSGHAQMAVVTWGVIAAELRKRWAWIAAFVLMGLIGLSRIYLGVHFPTDVLAGWAVGALVLIAYVRWESKIERQLTAMPPLHQIVLTLAVAVGLVLVVPTEVTTSILGILAGAGVGLVILAQIGGFRADGPIWKRGIRMVIGGAVLFALRMGLKAIFPALGDPLYLTMRFVRYTVMGVWTGLGAPWLFQQIHLADTP
jgi:hypothetical protein